METEPSGANRQPDGTFGPGNNANPNGRPPDTEEKKIIRKAVKDLIKEYKESLAEVLPELSPVLKAKALTGDVSAIRELHDRVMDKAPQRNEHSGKDGGPITVIIPQEIAEKNDTHSTPETNSQGQA